jgi:hypothetical protein
MWPGNHKKRNQIQKLMGVVDMQQLKKKECKMNWVSVAGLLSTFGQLYPLAFNSSVVVLLCPALVMHK